MAGFFMASRTDIAVEAAGVASANKLIGGGAIAGAAGWISQINWIGLSGVLVAVIGLFINLYFQHRRDKREELESQERIRALKEQCGP